MRLIPASLAPMLLVSVLLGSCATGVDEVTPSPADTTVPDSLPVAVNLVSVLVQLEGYSPYDTTVQVNAPDDAFERRLLDALTIAGYGVQTVSADQGRNYLSARSYPINTSDGRRTVFEFDLGALSVSRDMRLDGGRYVPASPITLRGVPPTPIFLNGSVYVARADRPLLYPSGVRFLDRDGRELSQTRFRYAYFPTGAARTDPDAEAGDPTRFLRQATARLFDRGRTVIDGDAAALPLRPAGDFDAYKALTIRFPGTSDQLLGQGNRNALEVLSGFFDASSDRITVRSCAPDRTRDDASIARSTRIKSELLTLGIPGAHVIELGCPSDTKRAQARKGILVTLSRLRPGA